VRTNRRSLLTFCRLMAQWWHQPIDYTGYVQFFAQRAMAGAIALMIGAGIGLTAVVSVAMLLPTSSAPSQIVVVLFAALNVFWALSWCTRPWPSLRRSRMFITSADIGITMLALIDSHWLTGLFALNFFALISVYLVFFDGPKALALHSALILLTTLSFIALTGAHNGLGSDSWAVVGILGAVVPVVSTSLGVQFGIHTLRMDAIESSTDPLTGALNRRGLHLNIGDLLNQATSREDAVVVIVVDIDRFKQINDTFGHAVGDKVLVRCAQHIRETTSPTALVARVGGEEFVIIDLAPPDQAGLIAEQIRQSITTSSHQPEITASVGVTTMNRAQFLAPDADPHQVLHTAITQADRAMFEAKRHGGNTTHHT